MPAAGQPGRSALRAVPDLQRLLHHRIHHPDVARVDDAAERLRRARVERLAVRSADAFDHVRRGGIAAVGERRIGRDQLQHRQFGGAERERWIGLELRGDAEPIGGARHRLRPELQRQPHRHGVERMRERLRQRHRPVIFAAVVLRLPALEHDRLVLAHAVRREAAFERGEIDKGLERRAGLALGRDRAVELALGVIPSADERAHRAIRRHRNQCALADAGFVSEASEFIDQRLLGRGLQRRIDRGLDRDVLLDLADQVVEHVHDPVGDVTDRARDLRTSAPPQGA